MKLFFLFILAPSFFVDFYGTANKLEQTKSLKKIQVMPAIFVPRSSNWAFSMKKDYTGQERILILDLSISIYALICSYCEYVICFP